MIGSWADRAACTDHQAALFFPESGQPATYAKALCSHCPVRPECLDHALTHYIKHGVWGGLTEKERRPLRPPRRTTNFHTKAAM